jgi:hypothetical protein
MNDQNEENDYDQNEQVPEPDSGAGGDTGGDQNEPVPEQDSDTGGGSGGMMTEEDEEPASAPAPDIDISDEGGDHFFSAPAPAPAPSYFDSFFGEGRRLAFFDAPFSFRHFFR